MSQEQTKELEAEYQRRMSEAAKTLLLFDAVAEARKQMRDFCLTTGKDISLLYPTFNAEDLAMANVAT
jgi:hypothetical protein